MQIFWFPPRFTLGFYFAYLYMLTSRVRKEVSHCDWLFVCKLKTNPRTLHCFGSPSRKFSNYSYSEQISGHITEIANYSYPRRNYS